MYRNYRRVAWALLLLTLASYPLLPLQGEEVPGALLVAPEPDKQEIRMPPDPALVPEVLRLPPAGIAAAATLESLREQEPVPGVPYQDGFQRSGSEQQVRVATDPAAWNGERAGQIRQQEGAPASWLGRFVVEDAYAFRVRLRDLELPEGAQIWLYAGGVRIGPVGHEMLGPDGTLWLPPAPGPEVVVEIELPVEPSKTSSQLSFTLGDVMEMVETPAAVFPGPQAWTDCDIDAMCVSTSYLSIINILEEAIARLSFVKGSSSFLCTGGLMNDKDASGFRPYLLTANHCFDTQSSASSLVAYFDYRTNSCNGTTPSLSSVPRVSGATLLASGSVSDFTLVELSGNPSGTTWYLGWTTVDPVFGTSMYRVSHPAGGPQKYSAASFVGTSGINCGTLPTSDFHYSSQFEGSTTGGSSGSPVAVNSAGDALVVGQLYGTCHFLSWDECSYSTYNQVDGAFSTTYPFVKLWLNDLMGCGDLFEPDDSAAAASFIASGSTQGHSICPVGDEDWAYFTLAAQSAVTVETTGPSGDTRMWLYNSSLSQLEFDDDDGTGLFSYIDRVCGVDALPAGTYYVKVDEFGDNDEIAAYNLSFDVVESCGGGGCPTDLTLSNDTITGTASYRAGNTITLGPALTVNGTVDMIAGQRIVFGDGTRIGGSFAAGTDPAACSL